MDLTKTQTLQELMIKIKTNAFNTPSLDSFYI
jgi:hypothetical protein